MIFGVITFLGIGWTPFSRKIPPVVSPRTGQEIYDSLFEKPPYDCVKIIHSQEIPSYEVRLLSFETCPKEMKRILARHKFTWGTEATKGWTETIPLADNVSWFVPQSMGDTIHIYEYSTHESRNIQTFWISRDSTQAFCRDFGNLKVFPKRSQGISLKNRVHKKARK